CGKPRIGSGSALKFTVGAAPATPGRDRASRLIAAASARMVLPFPLPTRASSHAGRLAGMDPTRARELLEGERRRVEQALAALRTSESQSASEVGEPGERDSEDLFERGLDDARAEDVSAQLAAVERAEE